MRRRSSSVRFEPGATVALFVGGKAAGTTTANATATATADHQRRHRSPGSRSPTAAPATRTQFADGHAGRRRPGPGFVPATVVAVVNANDRDHRADHHKPGQWVHLGPDGHDRSPGRAAGGLLDHHDAATDVGAEHRHDRRDRPGGQPKYDVAGPDGPPRLDAAAGDHTDPGLRSATPARSPPTASPT